MREVAVYVHVPFCEFKCGYCDFCALQIGTSKSNEKLNTLVDEFKWTLRAELLGRAEILRTCQVSSVFFGGGTPTILKAEDICFIIQEINNFSRGILEGAEITVETNPGIRFGQRQKYLSTLHSGGVNRLSVGVQSFDAQVLRTLERTQEVQDVQGIVQEAKQLGLKINLDLIYGTPAETLESWENSVKSAVKLDADHLSLYALTLEDGVRLAKQIKRGKLVQVDEDFQALKYERADEILQNSGYDWYEVSNWEKLSDKPGENRSTHNLNYWLNGEYIGIGPSAHSSLRVDSTTRSQNALTVSKRFWNISAVYEYVQLVRDGKLLVEAEEVLNEREKLYESALLRARLNAPITNCTYKTLEKLIAAELVNPEDFRPTVKGRLLNDEIVRILVEDELQNRTNSARSCPKYNTSQCLSCPQCVME